MNTKIIDGHMHIVQWFHNDGKNAFDIIKDYQKSNSIDFIDNMCCSNNNNLWDGYEVDQNILGAIAKLENPGIFTHGCLYLPDDPQEAKKFSFISQLEELMELGLDGVKICEFKPDAYNIMHVERRLEEYDDYIGYCNKYNVHMCWHVADPEDFWDADKISEEFKRRGWFYGGGDYPSYEKLNEIAYTFLDNHPSLNLLLAHAFFKSFKPDEALALLEKYPNVTIDFAPGWEMFDGFRTNYEKWYDIFNRYSDRFVYATDATMTMGNSEHLNSLAQNVLRFLKTDDVFPVQGNHTARGIKLDECKLENILYKNHDRTVGVKPNEINKSALKKYMEKYLPLVPDTKNKQMEKEYLKKL